MRLFFFPQNIQTQANKSFAFYNHSDKGKSLTLYLRAKLVKLLLGEIVFLSQVMSTPLFLSKIAETTYFFFLKLSNF